MMTGEESVATSGEGRKSRAKLCDTMTTDTLGLIFRLCQAEGELGFVTGEPGVGKTSAAKQYVASMASVHLVTASPATSSLVPFLQRLGATIGAYPDGIGAAAWTRAIRRRLNQETDAPLLLIDEADHLADSAIEEVRAIFDAIPSLGVVLIGGRELRDRLSRSRWSQLASRVYQSVHLRGALPADVDAICMAAGVDGKRSRDLLRRAANKPGALRVVDKLLGVASKLAGAGQTIKVEHVETACRDRAETHS